MRGVRIPSVSTDRIALSGMWPIVCGDGESTGGGRVTRVVLCFGGREVDTYGSLMAYDDVRGFPPQRIRRGGNPCGSLGDEAGFRQESWVWG